MNKMSPYALIIIMQLDENEIQTPLFRVTVHDHLPATTDHNFKKVFLTGLNKNANKKKQNKNKTYKGIIPLLLSAIIHAADTPITKVHIS